MPVNTKAKIEKKLIEYSEYSPIRKCEIRVRYYVPVNKDISEFKNAVIIKQILI